MRPLAFVLALTSFACSSGTDGPDGGGGAGGGGVGGAGGGQVCAFSTTYTIVDAGGLVPVLDTATLTPPNAFRYERRSFVSDAGQPFCEPAIPSCAPPVTRITAADAEAALAHRDVEVAFAASPLPVYGERGVADGPSFTVTLPNGHGFSVGVACDTPSPTCTPIPGGLAIARTVLRALISQQLADPSCVLAFN